MMRKEYMKFLGQFLLFLLSSEIAGQTILSPVVRIASYKDDKACAISYTFDDAIKVKY